MFSKRPSATAQVQVVQLCFTQPAALAFRARPDETRVQQKLCDSRRLPRRRRQGP